MTTRFRTRWLALLGAAALISLSMSAALGAKPEGTNRGQQVSTFVHSLQGEAEEPVEEEPVEEPVEEEPVEEEESAPSDHGKCVAAVAQDPEAVGPPNDNHGGAVSEAARVTCWEPETEEPAAEEPTEDEGESEVESEEADASGAGHGKGHGHGHGGDSSED